MKTRQLTNQLHLRSDSDTGDIAAELTGIAVPYGHEIDYGGIRESFAPDSFDPAQVVGVPLHWSHDRAEPIGHITGARNEAGGLEVDAVILPTTRGRDAAMLLRAGSVRGFSVGFEPTEQSTTPHGIRYDRATLAELSVTAHPAYKPAAVTSVREQEKPMSEKITTAEDPRVDDLTRQVSDLTDRLTEAVTRMAPPEPQRTLSVTEVMALAIRDAATTRQTRALADVVSGGNSGIMPPDWSSEVRRYVDTRRPVIANSGSMGFPATGYTLTVPKVTQETLVGARGAEKSEAPSRALTTSSDTFTAEWAAGAVDVAMELIAQSDPSVVSLVTQSLLDQYAVHSEGVHVTNATAAGTATGAALDTSSYATLIGDLIDGSATIRAATGAPGDMVAANTTDWRAILGLVDGDNRRVFATNGGTNADGSASLTAEMINIGGINVFHAWSAATTLQFNQIALRVAEKPPMQISLDNVALMGRDFGILGAILTLPLYPAGILKYSV